LFLIALRRVCRQTDSDQARKKRGRGRRSGPCKAFDPDPLATVTEEGKEKRAPKGGGKKGKRGRAGSGR